MTTIVLGHKQGTYEVIEMDGYNHK